jgi:hypothetical protein
MLLPNSNFNRTYLANDDDIREDRSEKQCNWGFDRGRAITEVWQKGRPVTITWLLSNIPFGPLTASPRSGHRNPVLPSPPHSSTMNSYSTEPEPSHGDLLADRLRRLDIPDDHPVQAPSDDHPLPKAPYDGYGFRPSSGRTSPRAPTDRNSPLPDVNGLGWPGKSYILFVIVVGSISTRPLPAVLQSQAKSTLSRLNASPAEKAARQKRLATAVRTVLECIGEDPDREGLLRTPERYAQALMWMTKGYEERLPGRFFLCHPYTPPPPRFFFSFSRASVPTPKD